MNAHINDLEAACSNVVARQAEHSYKTHQCDAGTVAVYSQDEWLELPFVGIGPAEDDDKVLEYRNCSCGSTIAVEHPRSAFEPTVEVPAPETSLTRLLTEK
jgi:hypothetical protein